MKFDDRRRNAEEAAREMAAIIGNGPFAKAFAEQSQWTDEEWEAHDAKVRADLDEANRAEAEQRERDRWSALTQAGWPLRALEAARAADREQPAVTKVLAWDTKQASVLVLSGQPGCGKTTAAALWAMGRSWAPQFVRATTFAASSRYNHEQRDGWLRADALVLDDLGAEYADAKGNFLVDLDELVDTFYGDRRPLLITTNCTDSEFKQRYGARIVDRIRECGVFFGIRAGSLRGRKP